MIIDVLMPKMGESITEGTIVEWKKKVGDTVEQDEIILEISTDKVDSEIPSPSPGKILEILYKKNDTIEVNKVIARIGTEGEDAATSKEETSKKDQNIVNDKVIEENDDTGTDKARTKNKKIIPSNNNKKRIEKFYSPLVRSIIEKENISEDELLKIQGSGKDGRINKSDILKYLDARISTPISENAIDTDNVAGYSTSFPKSSILKDEIEKMDRVRQRIAQHMVNSQDISAHVYTTTEVDVSKIVEIRNTKKQDFMDRYKVKLTYTPIIVSECIKVIQEFPLMNASIDEENIVHHQNINMGIAVALPDNNLIVPVIKNSEEMNFLGLSRNIDNYAKKARSNNLEPNDIFGSTFTVTNPGIFGGLFGMPIINQPNVGILSIGSIEKKPVVKETQFGDAIFIRHMLYLTLGYDHRLIDGAYGTQFLSRLKELLENYNGEGIII